MQSQQFCKGGFGFPSLFFKVQDLGPEIRSHLSQDPVLDDHMQVGVLLPRGSVLAEDLDREPLGFN